MTANGMPFATVTVCATVVRVASIIVAVESTWVDAATFNLLVQETIKYGAVQEGSQPSTIRRRHPSNGLVVVTLKSNGLIVTCWVDDGSRAWHTTQPCRFGTKCQRHDCVFMH